MVFEAADKKAAVYKVEFLGICPVVFDVADFECAIAWDTDPIRVLPCVACGSHTSLAEWDLDRCL